MTLPSSSESNVLNQQLDKLLAELSTHPARKYIQRALEALLRISASDTEPLNWKILTASLEDLEQGFQRFYPYRHTRKIAIFGSARTSPQQAEYKIAADFARCMTQAGFMVITGAGGGIMQAGNEGAGRDNSFGLNIRLPFEQGANSAINGDDKLIDFKYFFTRKLFFLKESDAIALFPGGFGTQDEAFETLTLCQTGKYGPVPLVLVDKPGGDYWHSWNDYICRQLKDKGLISPEDPSLYTITDRLDTACQTIKDFYRLYHSSRYVGKLFVMRLKLELSDTAVESLNQEFSDILVKGKISKSSALPEEMQDLETITLPRLTFYFNQKSLGRLYQLISKVNQLADCCSATEHPELK
ncbi:LOG family protein [Waterburya agarophytonicola K14]|uniref:LOG family protein n=1 Tax=Waterburya agarophytonicola KI4 TaxID=2874699 RepID=A0A964FH09_9CYAN|nr:LOG family protein [Waterburya agarophytonicola]MCC0177164.1 LOG family protein [Waterburya agarophytonicola KI4]